MKNTFARYGRLLIWGVLLLVSAISLATDCVPDRVTYFAASAAFLLLAAENFYTWRRSPTRGTLIVLLLNSIASLLMVLCALTAG